VTGAWLMMLNVSGRVKFLLEALTAIKNNNVHKLLDVDEQQQLMRLQKLLRTYTRGYTDLLSSSYFYFFYCVYLYMLCWLV